MTNIQSDCWTLATLDQLAHVGAGNPAPQDKKLFEDGKYPFIRTSDVGQIRFGEIGTAADLLNEQGVEKLRLVPKGTVLMPKSGASTFLNHRVVTTADAFVSSHLATITPKDGITDPRYLLYALSQVAAQDLLPENSYPSLNLNLIKTIKIPLLPLEEQQRIVAVLDEAFEGLDRARAHAEANLENTNEFFRNTLAKRTNSEGFPRVILSEFCDVRDGTHDTPKYVDSGVPLVTQKNIRPDGLSLENVKLISHDDHAAIHRRSNVAEGDILISMIGVNRGMSCLVDRDDVFSIKNVGLIKSTSEVNMNFLLYYLKSADAEKYVQEATNGGAQPFIGLGKLRAFPTPLPERAVQDRIAAELTEMRESVNVLAANYQTQIQDLDDLRQSLLQKAFAGELT